MKISNILSWITEQGYEHRYVGAEEFEVQTFSLPEKAAPYSIVWVKHAHNLEQYHLPENVLCVTSKVEPAEHKQLNFIVTPHSKAVFFSILDKFFMHKKSGSKIGKSSVIETQSLGKNVVIGEQCYLGSEVVIGNNVVIKNNVTLENKVIIGDNTVINSGVVIGAEGHGYYKDAQGRNCKVPHFGGVIVGSHCEIGANSAIARGTLGDTVIGDYVKFDNLCHVGHNVVIEDNVSLTANTVIAGSVVIKKNTYIGPGSVIMNQITIEENAFLGIGSVVLKSVEADMVVAGAPAKVLRRRREDE